MAHNRRKVRKRDASRLKMHPIMPEITRVCASKRKVCVHNANTNWMPILVADTLPSPMAISLLNLRMSSNIDGAALLSTCEGECENECETDK